MMQLINITEDCAVLKSSFTLKSATSDYLHKHSQSETTNSMSKAEYNIRYIYT